MLCSLTPPPSPSPALRCRVATASSQLKGFTDLFCGENDDNKLRGSLTWLRHPLLRVSHFLSSR